MSRSQTIRLGRGFSYRLHEGTYRLRVYDPNQTPKDKNVNLNTDSPALAAIRAQEKYALYITGKWSPWEGAGSYTSLGQALEQFQQSRRDLRPKTLADYTKAVSKIIDRVGPHHGLDAVTAQDIRPITQDPSLTQSSRLSYYQRLGAFFSWCVKNELLGTSPMARVERPTTPKIIPNGLESEELERLLVAAEAWPWARDAFRLLAWTGLRPAEAARLRWQDIDADVIRVVGVTKTLRHRAVTIIPQAREVLGSLIRQTPTVGVSRRVLSGGSGGPLSVGYTSRVFLRCARIAMLPERFTLYSLRHTFAAEYRRRGGSLVGLQYELGHASIVTTEKYGHLGPDERRLYTLRVFGSD